MLTIIDGLAYIRRAFEKDFGQRAPRRIISDMLAIRPPNTVVWAFDHPSCRTLRRKLYPEYKMGRSKPSEDFFPMVQLIRDGLTHTSAIQIEVPNYEADDIIATLVKRYPTMPIRIETIDRDLGQLLVNRNVTVSFEMKGDPRWTRLYKATVGDPSDNIPGIKGFGPKAFYQVDKRRLEDFVAFGHGSPPEMPAACLNWLSDPANTALVRTFYQIVGFYDVPDAEISTGTVVGVSNPDAADALLSQFLH